MALAQAPSATPLFPTTISPPYDGDPLSATQLRTDDLTPLQNGVEAARLLLYGGGFRRRVSATSNTVMVIQPLRAVMVKVGSDWQVVPHTTASTINPQTLAGGAFAAATRYYVYVNVVANAIVWSVSTTAPDVARRYKTGDEQYQFISTFFADGASNLLTYNQADDVYTYVIQSVTGSGVGGNIFLDGGAAIGFTNVALGASVPSTAINVLIHATAEAGAANAHSKMGSSTGFPDKPRTQLTLSPPNGDFSSGQFTIQDNFFYINDANTTLLYAWIAGFNY